MKFLFFVLLASCAVVYATAHFGTPRRTWTPRLPPRNPNFPPLNHRFRREEEPQGSVVLRGEKPLSGPDQRATLNLEYQQKLNEHTSAYGGGHYTEGDRVRPHAGIVYERQFGNGFINGRGQVQPGPRGRLDPSFGINTGFRFRRETGEEQEEELDLE